MKLFTLQKTRVKFLLFATLMVVSCKKDNDISNAGKSVVYHQPTIPEQAFPNESGDVINFKYGNDSIHVEKKGGRYVWMGDIAFDQATFDSLRQKKKRTASERTVTAAFNNIWPNAQVFFTILPGFTANELTMINNAINNWRANTALTFIQRSTQTNYINIVPGGAGSGLYSDYIGNERRRTKDKFTNWGFWDRSSYT